MDKAKSAVESQEKALRITLEFVKEVNVELKGLGFTFRGVISS